MTRTDNGIGIPKINKKLNKCLHYGAILCAVFILTVSASVAEAATFTVSTTADNGSNVSPTAGSLREAIINANQTTAADTINFSVAGTITPTTSLPTITQPVTINGYSAPGAVLNSGSAGFVGTLVVELSGASAGSSGIGLHISANNCLISGLAINRFEDSGIRIDTGTGNSVTGNFIGTNLAGTASLGNFNRGVLIVGSTGNSIGTTSAAGANVISGNFGTGISITGGGSAAVRNNFIGTDKNGTAIVANTQEGVRIVDSSGSTIGGANSSSRNIISGNVGSGVSIIQSSNTTSASGNVISANFIGVDITGNATTLSGGFQTSPVGNSGSGVLINAGGNTVGGNRTTTATSSTCVNACNVIAGNRANGVSISSNFAVGNIVTGNNIGVGANNTISIGNRDNGIQISNLAAGNTIGGTNAAVGFCNNTCNQIANNGDTASSTSARAGVYIDTTAGTGNAIRQASIYNNSGIGIDLGAVGSTANDTGDPDTGANDLQNFPIISSALTNGVVTGTLNSTPSTTFAVDFYRNDTTDTAVASEARTFIGSLNVTTNASGDATINFGAIPVLSVGQFITATATAVGGSAQSIGDTSEISAATAVTATMNAAPGIEGDVSPRPNGDGVVDASDIQEIRRFAVGTDLPFQSNEFQRADDSPRSSAGDGFIDSDDVQQARRYSVGTDPNQGASGPTAQGMVAPPALDEKADNELSEAVGKSAPSQSNRIKTAISAFRIDAQTARAGQTVTVPIRVNTAGNEAGYTFSIAFDSTKLTNPQVSIGNGGGDVIFNSDNPGVIGFSVTSFSGGTIAAADNVALVNVTFAVAANASAGTTNITFNDSLARRRASGLDPSNPITQPTYTGGAITVTGAAAGATISGRVSGSKGRGVSGAQVVVTNSLGEVVRTARTNGFGYYSVTDIALGETYTVSVESKLYKFGTRVISVAQNLDGIDFTPQTGK